MIRMKNTRFGTLAIDEATVITLPKGLIGFSDQTRFALVEREQGPIAFLQSLVTPTLAFTVLDASHLRPAYPALPAEEVAELAGATPANMAILVVVAASPSDRSLRANLAAPVIIDCLSRSGAQVLLAGTDYGTSVAIGSLGPVDSVRERTPSSVLLRSDAR